MWTLKNLCDYCNGTIPGGSAQAHINGRWVPARSENWKFRTLRERFREAKAVFTGKADCFMWPEGQ